MDSDQIRVRERREGRQCVGEKGARGGVRDVGETGDVRAVGCRASDGDISTIRVRGLWTNQNAVYKV